MSNLVEYVQMAKQLPAPKVARRIRIVAGVSQEQVATELGVNRVTVARWELGSRTPRGKYLLAYVELLEQLRTAAMSS